MKFSLSFDCDNEAFAEDLRETIADTLIDVEKRVAKSSENEGPIYDVNGNRIGQWELTDD